jgi:hypothetical protein
MPLERSMGKRGKDAVSEVCKRTRAIEDAASLVPRTGCAAQRPL